MISRLSPDRDSIHNLSAQMHSRRTSRSSCLPSGDRSSRIEKPRSNHNSPRLLERRKTTSGTRRYATLDDHFNMMFGTEGDDEVEEEKKERPFSWHPSSSHFPVPPRSSTLAHQTQPQHSSFQRSTSSRNSAYGDDFYSLSARNSMHSEQLLNYTSYVPSHESHRSSEDSESNWQTPAYTTSCYSTPATEPMPWYLQEWARKNQASLENTGNGSSDFLPIQYPTVASSEDAEMEDGKELIGMGLYDAPESGFPWSSSRLAEGTGKGLKLEETWQPPEDDDEEEDETSSDEGSVEELPAAKENNQLPAPASAKPNISGNMEGQSFFFDGDETYTKEWWFQQLQQPSLPARDAGLGHGWL
jgi:hypothetical protein